MPRAQTRNPSELGGCRGDGQFLAKFGEVLLDTLEVKVRAVGEGVVKEGIEFDEVVVDLWPDVVFPESRGVAHEFLGALEDEAGGFAEVVTGGLGEYGIENGQFI